MNFPTMDAMHDCVVCHAFPGHKGKHYSLRTISLRSRGARLRSLGKSKWVELSGCWSADGHPVLATVHMTRHPRARHVSPGCWLCEKSPDFDPNERMPASLSHEDLLAPQEAPVEALVEASAEAPAEALAEAPVEAPLELPVEAPAEAPVEAPLELPVEAPAEAPVEAPAETPVADEQPEPAEERELPPDEPEDLSQEVTLMADADTKGYLAWADGGLGVEIQSMPDAKRRPDVGELKKALRGFEPPNGVLVTLTETLGGDGAWVALAASAGGQADLLISAGEVVGRLVQGGVYEEVVLPGRS